MTTQVRFTTMKTSKHKQEELELWIDELTGLAYAPSKTLARILGIDRHDRAMLRRLEVTPRDSVKRIEIRTYGGIQWYAVYNATVLLKLALEFNLGVAEDMESQGANAYLLGQEGVDT
jgi:hypothetical protein